METRVMCDSHPPGSLWFPPNSSLPPWMLPATAQSQPHVPHTWLSALDQPGDQTQHRNHWSCTGAPAESGCPQWPLEHLRKFLLLTSLYVYMFFICKTGVPGPPFLSLLFKQAAVPCRAASQYSFPPSLAFPSRFVMYQLQWLLKFCSIIFLTPCPFSPNVSYLKNELFVFFQELCLRKVLAAPGSWEALEDSSSRSCNLWCIPFSFACHEAWGDPHLAPLPYMLQLQLHLIPHASPTACRDECVAPAGLPCWLQNLSRAFHQWRLAACILPHTVGNLALKSVGRGAQKLLRLSQGAGSPVDSRPTAPTTPSSAWELCRWADSTEKLPPPVSKCHPRAQEGWASWGLPECEPPASPQWDTAEQSRMDTCTASPPASHTAALHTTALAESCRKRSGKHSFS